MLREERFERAETVIRLGIWVNAVLMVMKLAAGHFGGSDAVFADGIESCCDFAALLFTMVALRVGRKPFDASHPYGHGKAENVAAFVIALVIGSAGTFILVQSVRTIMLRAWQTPDLMAVGAAFLTIIIKEALYRYSAAAGRKLDSPALQAVAMDHRKDALTSIGTLAGVGGAYAGFGIMDPLAAGLTSLFIFRIGYQTFRTAVHDLMDGQPPDHFIRAVTELAEGVEGVEHVHEIRGRRSGQYIIIDLKLDMDPEMTVKHSHDIATRVKQLIFDRFPNVGDVMIHINPHDEEHEDLIRL